MSVVAEFVDEVVLPVEYFDLIEAISYTTSDAMESSYVYSLVVSRDAVMR